MEANVSTRTIKSAECYEERKLSRALMGGTKEMIKRGTDFTPQYPGETHESYKARLQGTTLYNAFEDTIKKSAGKVLSKDIVLEDDVPSVIVEQSKNIDGQGRNLTAFTLDALKEALVDGISYIFIDFTKVIRQDEAGQPTGEEPFLSDQINSGARPNAILYTGDQLLGVKHENIDGNEKLTEIRFHECIVEPIGLWGEVSREQVRVQRIGSYELWRKEDESKDEWFLFEAGPNSLEAIPVVPVYTNRTGFMFGLPPLKSLAELNLEHWISSSEQRKSLVFARFAMMVFAGVEPGSITSVGPDQIITLRDPEASWGKVEGAGAGLEHGRLDLEAIKKNMETAGLTIQVQNLSGDVTATAASLNSEDANAALLAIAGGLEDSIDQVLQFFADYQSLGKGGTSSINKQFGRKLSTATVTDFIGLYNSGLLDDKTILTELQKRGDISEDLKIDEVLAQVKENMPTLLGELDLTAKEKEVDNIGKDEEAAKGGNPFAKGKK